MTIDVLKSISQGQILCDHDGYYVFEGIEPLPEEYKEGEYFVTEKNKTAYTVVVNQLKVGDRYKYNVILTKYFTYTLRPLKKPVQHIKDHCYLNLVYTQSLTTIVKELRTKASTIDEFVTKYRVI